MKKKPVLKSMQLALKEKRLNDTKQKLLILKHISKRDCVLLPYLNDESLHTLGEFIFNVVTKRVRLDNAQLKKVKRISEIVEIVTRVAETVAERCEKYSDGIEEIITDIGRSSIVTLRKL